MPPFEPLPTTDRINLIAHVYPLGGIDVRYAPEGGKPPMQAAALFGSRKGLAEKLKTLGLNDQANMIIYSDAQIDFTLLVPNRSELMEAFEFNKHGRLLG